VPKSTRNSSSKGKILKIYSKRVVYLFATTFVSSFYAYRYKATSFVKIPHRPTGMHTRSIRVSHRSIRGAKTAHERQTTSAISHPNETQPKHVRIVATTTKRTWSRSFRCNHFHSQSHPLCRIVMVHSEKDADKEPPITVLFIRTTLQIISQKSTT
jgi:hypothetical protein